MDHCLLHAWAPSPLFLRQDNEFPLTGFPTASEFTLEVWSEVEVSLLHSINVTQKRHGLSRIGRRDLPEPVELLLL